MHGSTDTDSVRVVLFEEANPTLFLALTEKDDRDKWKLPGGKFEKVKDRIESPDEAARRELWEELGVSREQVGLDFVKTLLHDNGFSERSIFVGVVSAGLIRPSDEIERVEWFTDITLPVCENQRHILGAVAVARARRSIARA
jgi:8-oxo-dGTP pyrophosphatase MutT (NUDIX family)